MIQKELKKYIKENILPIYEKKDWAHQNWHIYEVIKRSLDLAKDLEVDLNMVYITAVFHDIAYQKGVKKTEENSAKMFYEDNVLKNFFNEKQRLRIKEAIIDQRKDYTPRSIYGKIISTANHPTTIESTIRSLDSYYLEFFPNDTFEERLKKCKSFIEKKYGKNSDVKIYIPNENHDNFLKEINYYLTNPFQFKKVFFKIDTFLQKKYQCNLDSPKYIKRYNAYDDYLKNKYHSKVYKVSLNAGLSCPNIKNGHGCIFCSNNSGDFAGNKEQSIKTQFSTIQKQLEKKWKNGKFIAYFQAGTNTYAPLHILKEKYEEALSIPNVVGLSIATRSDAISKETLNYLAELNKKTDLTIELGLQSIHDKTLTLINRGHTLENFKDMVKQLHKKKIKVVVHIINGLPYETKEMMLDTVKYLNKLPIHGIKIHMLHILKNTPLEKLYLEKPLKLLSKEEYIDIVCDQLELCNQNIIIHRLTGDPNKTDLIEPKWLLKKFIILNDIEKELEKRNSYQGKLVS